MKIIRGNISHYGFKGCLHVFLLFLLIVLSFYLIVDYRGPSEIYLKKDTVNGVACLKAKDLLVQEFDEDGALFTTRGMIVYKLRQGDYKFEKIAHVPTGFSIWWLRNFSIIRNITNRPECIELITTQAGDLCAMSAGRLYLLEKGNKNFKKIFKLPHYGMDENYSLGDQGLRNAGIASKDNSVYLGEYFRNMKREKVHVIKSFENFKRWDAVYTFPPPDTIRHIHAIQNDPYSDKLWICTGDWAQECMIGWSNDDFQNINFIGNGDERWKACQLVFTENAVYWGTDSHSEEVSGIYKWDRKSEELSLVHKTDGVFFYGTRLAKGTIVMSTFRGTQQKIEKNDKTRIYFLTNDDNVNIIKWGTWKHENQKKPGFFTKRAKLRFQRNQGSNLLAISVLDHLKFKDSELILIQEEELIKYELIKTH